MWAFETVGNGDNETIQFGDMAWIVLDRTADGSKKLLLCKEDFYESWLPEDSIEREAQNGDFTWEVSYARQYLNSQFIEEHFSDEEEGRILEVGLENLGNPFGDDYKSASTNDKVFMLSLEEAVRYFAANPEAERYVLLEGELFYTRTPLDHKWNVSPILFNSEERWGEWYDEIDFDDEDGDRTKEIEKIFPEVSSIAEFALNAWVDCTEDTVNVRPAIWVNL